MKVCIVTVYNSENCGSFMQAKMLGKVIDAMGHNVVYLKRKRKVVPPDNWHFTKSLVRSIFHGKSELIPSKIKAYKAYRKSEKGFPVISEEQAIGRKEADCFVIGSDTLWNFDSDHFVSNKEYYWGQKMNGAPVITYAVSVSNTSKKKIESTVPVKEWLKNFSAVSVRDTHTKEVISEFTNKSIEMVCDPTLLAEPELYNELITMRLTKPFLLIYCFVDIQITDEMQHKLVSFARKHNMDIISYGIRRKWCDKSVCYDPKTFLSYFSQASFIVTNTFHGVMFSMIFNREFMALGKEKIKVREALDTHGLSDRLQEQNVDPEEIYNQKIDYDKVNQIIVEERQRGSEYLRRSLEEIENDNQE